LEEIRETVLEGWRLRFEGRQDQRSPGQDYLNSDWIELSAR